MIDRRLTINRRRVRRRRSVSLRVMPTLRCVRRSWRRVSLRIMTTLRRGRRSWRSVSPVLPRRNNRLVQLQRRLTCRARTLCSAVFCGRRKFRPTAPVSAAIIFIRHGGLGYGPASSALLGCSGPGNRRSVLRTALSVASGKAMPLFGTLAGRCSSFGTRARGAAIGASHTPDHVTVAGICRLRRFGTTHLNSV